MVSIGFSSGFALVWLILLGNVSSIASQSNSSRIILGLTLVNSDAELDLTSFDIADIEDDGIRIDLALYDNAPLTLRLVVDDSFVSEIVSVKFDLNDGMIVRTESVAPYYLGGNSDNDANEVNTLQNIGSYQLTISIFGSSTVDALLDEQTFTIHVIDSSIPNGGGTLAPTTTPLSLYDVANYTSDSFNGSINGELKKWHKVTIGFSGPITSETNGIMNPFTDYRLDVTFTHDLLNKTYRVPGFYACKGDSANSGASSGNIWLVHFRPDEIGTWSYSASFLEGVNVSLYNTAELAAAVDGNSVISASFFDGASGSFEIVRSDKEGRDFRRKGRLGYKPEYHHLQFLDTGKFYLKGGADSPENFLAYADFDGTPDFGGFRKNWTPHVRDYLDGDPTWSGGKGRGIIGAVNYLSSTGMNAFSFLTMNIQGDDENVYPYVSDSELYRIDCSKTAQWEIVFDHAERMGMLLHFKTQETENDQLLDMEGGVFGNARKLYYRELIARFGHHLGLQWNLGEENTNTDEQRKLFADYIKDIDPYGHPIVVHTFPGSQDEIYRPLLGYRNFDGVSIQTNPDNGYTETLKWINESSSIGRKWIVSYDEQGSANEGVLPDAIDPTHDNIRRNVLWANLMAGGSGVEYYFGYSYNNSDLTLQDFRSRNNLWNQTRYALEFFTRFPYWSMSNGNERVTNNNWCLLNPDNASHIVVYLPFGGSVDIDLRELTIDGPSYSIEWFDPLLGGDLKNGSLTSIQADAIGSIGIAPYNSDQDWAVLLVCEECFQLLPNTTSPTANPTDSPLSISSVPVTLAPSALTVNSPTSSPLISNLPTNTPANTPAPSAKKSQFDANDVGVSSQPTGASQSSSLALFFRLKFCAGLQFIATVALTVLF